MHEPGGAPKAWQVPAQRGGPPPVLGARSRSTTSDPETAPRCGHLGGLAAVATLAAGIVLLAVLGTGVSVIDRDTAHATASAGR